MRSKKHLPKDVKARLWTEGAAQCVILGKNMWIQKEAKQRIAALDNERRLLMKISDKGGVVVVADGDALITTYNCSQRH